MQQIPLAQIPSQRLNVTLADQDCTIWLYWRQVRLYMDLSVNKDTIFQGAICQNRVAINQSPNPLFSGSLHFFDVDGDAAPDFLNLFNGTSGRYMLVYVGADETFPDILTY